MPKFIRNLSGWQKTLHAIGGSLLGAAAILPPIQLYADPKGVVLNLGHVIAGLGLIAHGIGIKTPGQKKAEAPAAPDVDGASKR